jgi:hypothetical protein
MRSLDGNVKMNFNEWFEEHKDELAQLLRGDQEEALYKAWLAGYTAGLGEMGEFARELWTLK